ncbi:hypothetical protein SDJN02_03781, partial [Cucurbita argyrosperma subsp. argyrosperma]
MYLLPLASFLISYVESATSVLTNFLFDFWILIASASEVSIDAHEIVDSNSLAVCIKFLLRKWIETRYHSEDIAVVDKDGLPVLVSSISSGAEDVH